MTLGELIEFLEQRDPNLVVKCGFGTPHSYRGYYEQVAFEPASNVTVGELLSHARSALGKTFDGYKGGEFKMHKYTDTWIADYGSCGDAISELLMLYMVGEA